MANVLTLPKLYEKQRAAFFGPHEVGACEGSTKSGKSVGGLEWLIHEGVEIVPGTSLVWVSPIYPQAKVMYRRVRRWFSKARLPEGHWSANDSELRIGLPNGSSLWFKGSDNPDSIYGSDYTRAVIDEASRCKEDAYHAVTSTLTATKGLLRCIGNVKGRGNWFFRLCRQCETEPGMRYTKITAMDAVAAGVLDGEYIEKQRRRLPENVFRELFLAEPSDDGGNPFGLAHIEGCLAELSDEPPVVFGVDLAKSVDWTVVVGLDRLGRVCRFERWQGSSWPVTKDRIRGIVGHYPTLVDSTGVGDSVLDDLQRSGGHFEGYKFTQSSKMNLLERLIVAVQSRQVAFPDNEIRAEMEVFEYEHTRTGVRYAAPSPHHDDCVMALALAVWHLPSSEPIAPTIGTLVSANIHEEDTWTPVGYGEPGDPGRRYL